MRRFVLQLSFCAVLLINMSPAAFCQKGPDEAAAEQHSERSWAAANFAIFAVLFGWFLAKYGPRFFNARSADIQKAINDATGLKMDADLRYSEIDRKMASLADEVKKMREEGSRTIEEVHQKMLRETQEQIAHIRRNAEAEIEALRNQAALRLQKHTAQMALTLAEQRLRDRFRDQQPADIVPEFIRLVERGKN